jgi:glycosyltransferase involved in cell wall biosynthesis
MLRKLITNQQLICHHHGDPPWSIIAAEKKKLAIHLTRRNYLSHIYFFHRRKAAMELSQRVIAVSDFIKNELELTYKINPLKITRIYNGVDTDYFRPIDSVPRNDNLILFVGRINPVKGLHYLIEAMSYVCKYKPNATLIIVGKGNDPYYHRLLEMVNHYRLESRVKFMGYITKRSLVNLYNMASLVAIPSVYEPFPLVAVEALSCGRPVIASNAGGLKEIIYNGKNGFLVPPRSRDLADTIISVLNRENFSLEIGKNGRETVLKHFTLQKQIKQILNVYNYVLHK